MFMLVLADAGVGDSFVSEEPAAGVVADAEDFALVRRVRSGVS